MKTIAVYLGYEPYPKQGGMERVTDILLRMLAERYKVIMICKKKNRLGESYTCPVPIYFLPQTIKEQRCKFIAILQENKVDILIDQVEGEVIGRNGIFRGRGKLGLPNLKCIAVQHSSAMSVLKNYYIVKHKDNLPPFVGWFYHQIALPILKQRAYRLQRILYTDLNANYDKIVTLSASFITHFYTFSPRTAQGKVTSISNPNTYEMPVVRTRQEKNVLYVGRLDNKTKGIDRLLRIWERVEKRRTDWKLKIVGDGQDKVMLVDLSHRLQLRNVSFEGFQVPKPYYEAASIFCMTSTFEGFGMVLTEAMQHGVVPIAFNSYDALQDIVTDGIDGLIIPAFDENLYADRLLSLMNDSNTRHRMTEQAIVSSSRFSKDKIAQKWYDLIES